MLNLQSINSLKRMLNVSGLHATVVLFQLASVATMSIPNPIKMALHMVLENGAAKVAISITAAKKILLFVLSHLRPPHVPLLHPVWFQM